MNMLTVWRYPMRKPKPIPITPSGRVHVVMPQESLLSIAAQYGYKDKGSAILHGNRSLLRGSPGNLKVGQALNLP